MRGRLSLLYAMMIFAWAGPSKLELATNRRLAACAVAAVIVSDWRTFQGDYAFRFSVHAKSPHSEIGFLYDQFAFDVLTNNISPKWPKALIRQLPQNYFGKFRQQAGFSPFVECPNLKKVAGSEQHEVRDTYFNGDKPLVRFSLPYLSKEGREALFVYSITFMRDGHSSVVLYRKNDLGIWEMADEIRIVSS